MMLSLEQMLQLSILLPLLATLGIVATDRKPNLREGLTITTALLVLYFVVRLCQGVLAGEVISVSWGELLPGLAVSFTIEPLGMLFALIAALLWPINTLYSIGYMRGNSEQHQTRFYTCFAIAIGSVMGIAFADNLFTFFIFYEVLTLSTYPLVTHAGTEKAKQGGRTYLGILLFTSVVFLLLAIMTTWYLTGTLDFRQGGILSGHIEGVSLAILLALFMFGIGKAALMPFHRWLPAAMVAPTPVSALLHAVAVVKAGVFGVVKVVVYIFGIDLLQGEPGSQWLLYAASFTLITASLIALRQDNLKRRLAYSTIGQLSYVILAAAILAPLSLVGAALHIAAHAFGKITLFFAAGSIYTAAHKTEVSQLNGIGWRMPWTMGAFTVGAISMIGLPPTAGFLSKWYMLMGAFEGGQMLAVAVILVSTLLNAAYFVPIIYAAWFRQPTQVDEHGEAPRPIVVALTLTAALTLLLFLFPTVPLELATTMTGIAP